MIVVAFFGSLARARPHREDTHESGSLRRARPGAPTHTLRVMQFLNMFLQECMRAVYCESIARFIKTVGHHIMSHAIHGDVATVLVVQFVIVVALLGRS